MTEITSVVVQDSIRSYSDSQAGMIKLNRRGELITNDFITQSALEGRVFAVNVGTLTTPTTFNATIAAGEPDLVVGVPSGTTIIPVFLQVNFEDTGTAQVLDVVAVASAVLDVTATATAITPVNMRTDAPNSTACTAIAVVTAGGTTPYTGNYVEFWRPYAGFGEDAFNGSTGWVNSSVHGASWSAKNAACPPVIVGPGSLNVYAAAQAGTGFITAVWVEMPSVNVK